MHLNLSGVVKVKHDGDKFKFLYRNQCPFNFVIYLSKEPTVFEYQKCIIDDGPA